MARSLGPSCSMGFTLTGGEEIRAALFVFLNPFLGEAAVANFGQDFAHFLASLLGDDARAGGIVTLLGGVADGVAHVTEAAAVNQIHD